MKTEKKLIPLLRFPAFQQDGEWENVKLGDCLLKTPDYGLNAPAVPYSESLPKYLRITDITDSGKFDKSHLTSVNAELTSENSLQEGDLVVARTGASVGKVYKYRKEDGILVFAGFLIRLRPNPSKCYSDYLFQYMLSPSYKRWVIITSVRSGQPGINSTEYASLPVPFPQKLSEQQKVAECLSSIDSYISSINEKVEQLKAHKKSIIQKMFPQKGHTVPEYRFSEFKESGEWTEKTLGDIGDVCMCKRIMKDETNINYSIPFYKIGTFGKKADTYITEEQFNEYKAKYTYPQKGDILFSAAGTIGRFVEFDGEHAYFQDSNIVWISNDETLVCNKFLKYLYSKVQWNIDDGGVVKRLYNDSIRKTSILIPSLFEQHKIADCLSSIDEAIRLYLEKAILMERHKKGLMQQLFPTSK